LLKLLLVLAHALAADAMKLESSSLDIKSHGKPFISEELQFAGNFDCCEIVTLFPRIPLNPLGGKSQRTAGVKLKKNFFSYLFCARHKDFRKVELFGFCKRATDESYIPGDSIDFLVEFPKSADAIKVEIPKSLPHFGSQTTVTSLAILLGARQFSTELQIDPNKLLRYWRMLSEKFSALLGDSKHQAGNAEHSNQPQKPVASHRPWDGGEIDVK
jgi:hypothetical protein